MPQDTTVTVKSNEHDALSKLDTFFTQLRHEAAHGRRQWILQYTKHESGTAFGLQLDAPADEAAKEE